MARLTGLLSGPFTRLGLIAAGIACGLDQAVKYWLLSVYDLANRGIVAVLPVFDLVLTWNHGISYGLFQQEGALGRWLLLGARGAAIGLLWVWLARAESRLTAISLGLVIGGAVGNGIDQLAYGAVADFVLLHLTTARFSLNWYVFNLADAAIVAGVAGLLYESLILHRAAKAP